MDFPPHWENDLRSFFNDYNQTGFDPLPEYATAVQDIEWINLLTKSHDPMLASSYQEPIQTKPQTKIIKDIINIMLDLEELHNIKVNISKTSVTQIYHDLRSVEANQGSRRNTEYRQDAQKHQKELKNVEAVSIASEDQTYSVHHSVAEDTILNDFTPPNTPYGTDHREEVFTREMIYEDILLPDDITPPNTPYGTDYQEGAMTLEMLYDDILLPESNLPTDSLAPSPSPLPTTATTRSRATESTTGSGNCKRGRLANERSDGRDSPVARKKEKLAKDDEKQKEVPKYVLAFEDHHFVEDSTVNDITSPNTLASSSVPTIPTSSRATSSSSGNEKRKPGRPAKRLSDGCDPDRQKKNEASRVSRKKAKLRKDDEKREEELQLQELQNKNKQLKSEISHYNNVSDRKKREVMEKFRNIEK